MTTHETCYPVTLQLPAHPTVSLFSTLGAALPRRQLALPTPSYWALSTISTLWFSPLYMFKQNTKTTHSVVQLLRNFPCKLHSLLSVPCNYNRKQGRRHCSLRVQRKPDCLCLWRLWLPVAAVMAQPSQRQPATINVCKTRGCNYSFELLMMGGVSPETCWAIKKHWNNIFYYTIASCWFCLWGLCYDARIYEHQSRNLLSDQINNV
jgi:hypothetical protein